MKKGFSIILILLMLAAMLHITIATHFCGGEVAASKVSISGKLASCGMEDPEKRPLLPGTSITTHCCDDVVTSCVTDSKYTPSFSIIPDSYQNNFQIFSIVGGYPVHSLAVLRSISTNIRPPGALMCANVDLTDICVFRI